LPNQSLTDFTATEAYLSIGLLACALIALVCLGLWLGKRKALQFQCSQMEMMREQSARELAILNEQVKGLETDLRVLEVRKAESERSLGNQLASERQYALEKFEALKTAKDELKRDFEVLAGRVLRDSADQLSQNNQERLGHLLTPLKDQLEGFRKRVDEVHTEQTGQTASLVQQLTQLRLTSEQASRDAQALTRALRGDNKKAGNWGELVLEKVLEHSGLVEGREFEREVTHKNYEGKRQRPDVMVYLPEGKTLIIDSKVSLVAWDDLCRAETDAQRHDAGLRLVDAFRQHVKGLAAKAYDHLPDVTTIELVFMFVPVEGAFARVLELEPALFDEAFDKRRRIVPVSPTTLLASLKTVAHIWQVEKQNRHALEIARTAGVLYDKFVGFVTDLDKLGDQIQATRKTWQQASGKLHEGRGNLVRTTERLRELGAKASKQIPETRLEMAGDALPEPGE
jgi:DNA recombination protein RmuC